MSISPDVSLATRPLPFDPAFEQVPDDEADTARQLVETMRHISEVTSQTYKHAVRSVHAKSHGLLEGELRVFDGLPPELAQGVFARATTYPVIMRLSTNPGDILDDSVSTPRGLAIKIEGVEGERLPGSALHTSQDFVMVNAPAFTAATPAKLLANMKLLSKTTERAPNAKKALSAVLRGTEKIIEAFGGESGTIKSLGGHPETHILGESFFTCVPFLYGPYFAKLAVVPVSPDLTALIDAPLDVNGHPNALREAVLAFFANHGAEWEVRVQLATDIDKMPVEDASVEWPQDLSPYVPVARIVVARQPSWSDARKTAIDDGMMFSPWHGLAAHRPLGAMMRIRQPAYEMSSGFRAHFNGCPVHG